MDDLMFPEIVQRLEHDQALDFKQRTGDRLARGKCPACGKQEAYLFKDLPLIIHCPRSNNCGEKTHLKELDAYKDFFVNMSEKYPPTEQDPNITARMYLKHGRGFDAELIDGMYKQGSLPIYDAKGNIVKYAQTVEFPLWGHYTWQRIIDQKDIQLNRGKKNHITKGLKFAGKAWQPPKQSIETNDWVFITEGILKSIALTHCKTSFSLKTIAAISSSNLPSDVIQEHQGKNVVWVIALDNDKAGINASKKWKERIESEFGERCIVALPPKGFDWDDLLKQQKESEHPSQKNTGWYKRLDENELKESMFRGALATALSHKEKLFWLFARSTSQSQFRFEFSNCLWRANKNDRKADENALSEFTYRECWANPFENLDDMKAAVYASFDFERISNCYPQFLYIEKDAITQEQYYFFKVFFTSGNPYSLIPLEGSNLQSPSAFSTALLNQSAGGTFDGNQWDLKYFRDAWFSQKINQVRSLPFVGYDKETQMWVYPFGGYYKNRLIEINDDGFIKADKVSIKTSLKSLHMQSNTDFAPDWFKDFYQSFSTHGLVMLAWWLGCLFAEQIRKEQKSWCFFELTGEQGAGKSTFIEFLWKLLGRSDYEGFDPNKSSPAGRARNFVQPSNMPVVLIEGDRDGDQGRGARKGGFDFDELKTCYNGRGFRSLGVAKRGSDTEELPFRGGIVFAQNATIDGSPALLARIVHCHVDRAHHTDKSAVAVKRIEKLDVADLAGFLHKVLTNSSTLFQNYLNHFDACYDELAKALPDVQGRLVLNHAQVYAWAKCLPAVLGSQFKEAHITEIRNHLIARARDRQERLKADHPMVAKFWEIYEAFNEPADDGKELSFDSAKPLFNHSKNLERIAINLVDFEAKAKKRGVGDGLDFSALKRLLPNSQSYPFVGQKSVLSELDGKTKYCWVFKQKQGNS